jgi:sarcosine oxidase subunit alpha
MPRLRPPRDPVTLQFDGEAVVAERGEPAAAALVAAGHLALARSAKFHRPRGPACMRAACDGCLARVDGEPNVMTCRVPAAEGMRIETQNVVGSKDTDLLRMADWFFPEGMNHHELFAGVPGVQRVMQAFARRVAGLGKLPRAAGEVRSAVRRQVDVLVVGAGAGGMSVALALAARGRAVEVIDDDLAWGGGARTLGGAAWEPLLSSFGDAVRSGRVAVRVRTTAAGIYRDDVLVAGEGGVEVLTARTLVLAPGAHDGVLPFEGNDVPGVMSARAAMRLVGAGVAPGKRVVVVASEGMGGSAGSEGSQGGPFGEAVARALPGVRLVAGTPVRVKGSSQVKEVVVATARGEERFPCDALLVEVPVAPAYELCAQAGAELVHEPRGFVVQAPGGRIRGGVFALGEVAGTPLEPGAMAGAAAAIAAVA